MEKQKNYQETRDHKWRNLSKYAFFTLWSTMTGGNTEAYSTKISMHDPLVVQTTY